MKEIRKERPSANAKAAPSRVQAPKLSPLAQSIVDQISELDLAGKLGRNSKVTVAVNQKASNRPDGDAEFAGESLLDPNEASEPNEEEQGLLGVIPQARGRMGVYEENGDVEPDEGSMLADVLRAVTRKAPTPPLRNSKGQISIIRMAPGNGEDL
jgi:hypothetical protein